MGKNTYQARNEVIAKLSALGELFSRGSSPDATASFSSATKRVVGRDVAPTPEHHNNLK